MPILQSYTNMDIILIQRPQSPCTLLRLALDITMKQGPIEKDSITSKQMKYLLDAEHTSLLEHASYTFLIKGVSRSFLAQITRHRASSFTTGSQHYQRYEDYPCVMSSFAITSHVAEEACNKAYQYYLMFIQQGLPKEEARQVLPNAAAVNILWTIDARNLVHFLKLRLCKRNVLEMRIFATRVLSLARDNFPELFNHVGPQCFMDTCKQGKLKCGEEPWR